MGTAGTRQGQLPYVNVPEGVEGVEGGPSLDYVLLNVEPPSGGPSPAKSQVNCTQS